MSANSYTHRIRKATALNFKGVLFFSMILVLLFGCSRTKDTFTSRVYHQMVSQFNPLFNGEQALLKGEQSLAQQHTNDFEKILEVFPIGTEEQATSVKPDMDKAIEKATKVIQRHSMMIRNDQKNNLIDDSYLLIGKARYYNREYLEALETFNYVIQQFRKSKVHKEAILWAAKTETAMGNYLSAQEKFERIYRSDELSKNEKAVAFASYAELEIKRGNKMAAYQLLEQATDRSKDKGQKVRWLFIMGQLQSVLGNQFKASQLFEQVIKKGPPYELLFQAQIARARNFDVDLENPRKVFKDLEAMIRDDKNYDNRDQIYYVMSEIAERMGDEALMEEYLVKSIRASTTNTTQKALSFLKLAETNFNNSLYPTAAAYYDSAYSNLPPKHEKYSEVERKKESLAGLVENLKIIATQDSLLVLANMGEKQRLRRVQEIVEKEEEEEARAMEAEQNRLNMPPVGDNSIALAGQSAIAGGQWYFYNQNLRSSGLRDFRNRFGNRELEDHWRRKDKQQGISFQDNTDAGDDEADSMNQGQILDEEEGEDKVTAYLKNIPQGEEQIEQSHQKIIDASLKIGDIYRNDLRDLMASERQYKALLVRYPEMVEKGRVWYILYRLNVMLEDQPEAEKYEGLILSHLPESEYATLVRGEGIADPAQDPSARLYYEKTYRSFKGGNLKKTLAMSDSGLAAFAGSAFASRFMLLKAYSQGQSGESEKMEQILNTIVAEFPGTEQAAEAQLILDHIGKAEELSTSADGSGKPLAGKAYKVDQQEEHKYLVLVPNTRGLVNNVTIDIINFNNKFFKNVNLNAKSVYLSPEEQMILVSGLPNKQKALQYFRLLNQENVLENNLASNEIKHFVISNSNFTDVYQEKAFSGYLTFFNNSYLQ